MSPTITATGPTGNQIVNNLGRSRAAGSGPSGPQAPEQNPEPTTSGECPGPRARPTGADAQPPLARRRDRHLQEPTPDVVPTQPAEPATTTRDARNNLRRQRPDRHRQEHTRCRPHTPRTGRGPEPTRERPDRPSARRVSRRSGGRPCTREGATSARLRAQRGRRTVHSICDDHIQRAKQPTCRRRTGTDLPWGSPTSRALAALALALLVCGARRGQCAGTDHRTAPAPRTRSPRRLHLGGRGALQRLVHLGRFLLPRHPPHRTRPGEVPLGAATACSPDRRGGDALR